MVERTSNTFPRVNFKDTFHNPPVVVHPLCFSAFSCDVHHNVVQSSVTEVPPPANSSFRVRDPNFEIHNPYLHTIALPSNQIRSPITYTHPPSSAFHDLCNSDRENPRSYPESPPAVSHSSASPLSHYHRLPLSAWPPSIRSIHKSRSTVRRLASTRREPTTYCPTFYTCQTKSRPGSGMLCWSTRSGGKVWHGPLQQRSHGHPHSTC